jgi:hypothetical protein
MRSGRRIAGCDQSLADADLGEAAEKDHQKIQNPSDASFHAG